MKNLTTRDIENVAILKGFVDRKAAQASAAPRCSMCERPARMPRGSNQYAMYCGGKACTNRERLCAACTLHFHINVNGAGTKYCSDRCKDVGYRRVSTLPPERCAWCDTERPDNSRTRGKWPYLCMTCYAPIRHLVPRLKAHNVSIDQAHALLKDPLCPICKTDIVRKEVRSDGQIRALLVVDHDHGCCPGVESCGNCVRGLLCPQCNTAAGLLRDNAEYARRMADYLDGGGF